MTEIVSDGKTHPQGPSWASQKKSCRVRNSCMGRGIAAWDGIRLGLSLKNPQKKSRLSREIAIEFYDLPTMWGPRSIAKLVNRFAPV